MEEMDKAYKEQIFKAKLEQEQAQQTQAEMLGIIKAQVKSQELAE